MNSTFLIQKQTEAEKDQYLLDCFHDAGVISELINSSLTILSGRKGSGKTALARYLESNFKEYNIDYATKISLRDLTAESADREDHVDTILMYILIRIVQKIIRTDLVSTDIKLKWQEYLQENSALNVVDYQSFSLTRKENKSNYTLGGGLPLVQAKALISENREYSKNMIPTSITPYLLYESILASIPKDKSIFILIDDISDYLDDVESKKIEEQIKSIQSLLLKLDSFNSQSFDEGRSIRIISLLRSDLFDFMQGSNINKLRSSSLELTWTERDFAALLIRRLPFFQSDLKKFLLDPVKSLKIQFPDEIFSQNLEEFKTKNFATNFYAYMIAISFNRPRDFLRYCYAMRDRLSLKHPAERKNIESAEIEYSDFFRGEVRDELYLASKFLQFDCDDDGIDRLIQILAKEDGVSFGQLKSDLGRYIGIKYSIGNKKIGFFINELWWYGVLGYKQKKSSQLINFRYMNSTIFGGIDKLKEYIFYLHRGLMWFARKSMG